MSVNTKRTALRAVGTVGILAAASLLALAMDAAELGGVCVVMAYFLGIILTTVATKSYICGSISAFSGVMLVNFLFTEPRYSLMIKSPADIATLAFFFIAAIIAGSIMSRLQKQTDAARRNEQTARFLYDVSGGFVHVTGEQEIARRAINLIGGRSGLLAVVALAGGAEYGSPPADRLPAAAFPLSLSGQSFGEIRVYGPKDGSGFAEHELLLKAIATQTSLALERERIYGDREKIRVAMDREKTRATLLRAVAHDLRSPLTALQGSSTALAEKYDAFSDSERREMAKDISEEMTWLANLVENILNMTRISEGRFSIVKEPEIVDDVVNDAVSHMKQFLTGRRFSVTLPDEVISAPMDGSLVARAIINLLDNAVRHTPPDAPISLRAEKRGESVEFVVEDGGPGVSAEARAALFHSFTPSEKGVTDARRGMGLGLAICRAVAEAHGGSIRFDDAVPHGARFTITLPLGADAPEKAHGRAAAQE